MALFYTNTTASLSDLISQVYTFLTTTGAGNPDWSADDLVLGSGEMAISKDCAEANHAVEVAFQWSTATPDQMGVYQYRSGTGAGSYNTGLAPYQQANDSGNGAQSTVNATLGTSRFVQITNAPLRVWVFSGDPAEGHTHAYVVAQTDATHYSHFGFGMLEKTNDWDGGEFAYGQRHNTTATTNNAVQLGSTALLDGILEDSAAAGNTTDAELFAATIRCQNLPNQAGTGLYAIVGGNQLVLGNDRQSTPRARVGFIGGFRANEVARSFGVLVPSISQGYLPGYPIGVAYRDLVPATSQFYYPMGFMRDVRGISLNQFTEAQELTIGSDTWIVFPTRRKAANTANASANQGIMYRVR